MKSNTSKQSVCFLDIDGVWQSDRAYHAFKMDDLPGGKEVQLAWDPLCIKLVDRLCEDYNLKVVVSSTWRQHENLDVWRISRTHGFRADFHPDWQTPQLFQGKKRGHEIGMWLNDHPEVTRYLILDDNDDMLEYQKPFFVQTSTENGILWEHYMEARKKLYKMEEEEGK